MKEKHLILTLARLHDSIARYLDYIRYIDIKKGAKNSAKIDKYFKRNNLARYTENALDILENKDWDDFNES